MKNYLLKRWAGLAVLALIAMVTMVSCDDDPDPDPPILVEDGLYVQGAGTGLTDLNGTGLMAKAKNEVNQTERASLYEMYVAVKGGSDGFNLVDVVGGVSTSWGPGSDFAEVSQAELDGEEPNMGLWKGSYAESETAFTVPDNGLYHVVVDTELGLVAIAKVEWGLIGAATPGGWSGSTQFDAPAFDLNMMEFSSTDLIMTKGDFKYRYSNGWKIILDADVDLGEGVTGVKVNCNFGGALDALDAGGANINNDISGFYTATMKWELGGAHSATLTKTDDLPSTNYSAYEMGLVGDGIMVADTAFGWGATYMKVLPTDASPTYTWTWTGIEIATTGSFKIRQGDDWDGLILGYPQVTMAGSSADNFGTNDDGNFVPVADGTFDFTLVVDAVADAFTLTVEPVVK